MCLPAEHAEVWQSCKWYCRQVVFKSVEVIVLCLALHILQAVIFVGIRSDRGDQEMRYGLFGNVTTQNGPPGLAAFSQLFLLSAGCKPSKYPLLPSRYVAWWSQQPSKCHIRPRGEHRNCSPEFTVTCIVVIKLLSTPAHTGQKMRLIMAIKTAPSCLKIVWFSNCQLWSAYYGCMQVDIEVDISSISTVYSMTLSQFSGLFPGYACLH